MNTLTIAILCLGLASCSPRQHDQRDVNPLPNYSDMGAASDAGQVKP
jgi:hypothetical protein